MDLLSDFRASVSLWFHRLLSLFRRRRLDADMAEEMRAHLAEQTQRNIAAPMSDANARAAAHRQFGGMEQIKEHARDQRGWRWLENLAKDVGFSSRMLRKNPGFTVAAVIVLALGIGANTTIFNLVHTLLFAPPAYARPTEIVRVYAQDKKNPKQRRDFFHSDYETNRDGNDVFSSTLAYRLSGVALGEPGDTRRAMAALVTSNYFSVLGVAPARGRTFLSADEAAGRALLTAIVSHKIWKERGFDPAFVGSTLQINGRPFTVVGVMPPEFAGTLHLFTTEVWLPLGAADEILGPAQSEGSRTPADRTGPSLLVLGRLRSGLSFATAEVGLKNLAARLEQALPVEERNQTLRIEAPSRFATGDNDRGVALVGTLLAGMAAIVLLVACLNLASMLLARGTARRKEIAIRLALGAGRARVTRQLLTEGLLLALLGGGLGLLLALWSSDLLIVSLGHLAPSELAWSARPQPALLIVTFGFCVLGTLAFALGPALKLSRLSVTTHLKEHAGEDPVRRRWRFLPRHPLVVAQIALSLGLLTAGALFLRGANEAASADSGLKTSRTFLVELDASLGGHDQRQARDVYRRLGERFAALPGVEHASVAIDVPFGGQDLQKQVRGGAGTGDTISAKWNGVGADYFLTVGLPLLRGRAFTTTEVEQPGGPPVAIINEVLAQKLWPDGDALGQHLQFINDDSSSAELEPAGGPDRIERGGGDSKPGATLAIVGIVPAIRHTLFEKTADPDIYLPFARGFQSHVFFHVQFASLPDGTEGAPADLLRQAVREVDATVPVLAVKTFARHLDTNVQIWMVRAGAALFSVFGGLALGLAVIGIYGVVAYSVARRTREIGIRMALGARPDAVQRMILRESAVMLDSGLLIGILLAVAVGQLVSHLLYQVGALDPIAFTVAPTALAVAALLACYVPARRATRVNPLVALRSE